MTHTRSFKTHENKGDLHIDLVMSPAFYAGLIGNIEVNAVGSGSATYNLERSDGACCEFSLEEQP